MPSLCRQALSAAASILYSGPSCRGSRIPAVWEIEMMDGPKKIRELLAKRVGRERSPALYSTMRAEMK
jgi:hypothetical protein